MGKLKKIALVFLFIVASTGLLFLRYWAYYPMETLEITGKASTTPQGAFSCTPIGDELALYTEGLMIEVEVSIRSSFYKDTRLEEARYLIYFEDLKIGEGSFQDITIDHILTTKLPPIQQLLDMEEIAGKYPELIEAASQNRGLQRLRVIVELSAPALFLDVLRIGTAETSSELSFEINLLDTVRVSGFEWKSDYRTVSDCNPGDELVGEFEVWKKGGLGESVEAEILEIVNDGSTRSCTRVTLDEGLTQGYNMIEVSWSVPEAPSLDCIGYSIRLIYENVEVWSQPLVSPSLQLFRVLSLLEAFTEEGITITLTGTGYCSGETIKIKIKAELEASVDLKVESGTVLVNSGEGQNMIIAETSTVRIEPEIELEIKLEAYCLDMYKDNPSQEEGFTISEDSGYCVEAIELIQSLSEVTWEHKSVPGIQLALWAVIEDPLRSEVSSIFRISESDLEDAAWLLENIGIDHTQKNLFREA